jgi:hypothetical protein
VRIAVFRKFSSHSFEKRLLAPAYVVLAAALYIFFLSETRFSYAVISWHADFENALLIGGEVKLQSLVKFPSEKIYFVEPFSNFDPQTESQVFSYDTWLNPFWFWWRGDERYLTIAYQRKNQAPFLIRLNKNEWNMQQPSRLWTLDPEAKLVLIQPNTPEAVRCTRSWARCIALSDQQSNK